MEIKEYLKKNGFMTQLKKNKYIVALLIFGIALLLIPTGGGGKAGDATEGLKEPYFSLSEQERRIEEVLSKIAGAGKVDVMLTLKSGIEREYAVNRDVSGEESQDTYVTIQTGSGTEAVTVRYIYPIYQGALVVCEGGGSAAVRLQVTEAVAALTGLSTDKITVTKMGN